MLQTFSDNLTAAIVKEVSAEEVFAMLQKSLNQQLETAQAALREMPAEGAAKGLTLEVAQEEDDALKLQVENDLRFIKETEDSLAGGEADADLEEADADLGCDRPDRGQLQGDRRREREARRGHGGPRGHDEHPRRRH